MFGPDCLSYQMKKDFFKLKSSIIKIIMKYETLQYLFILFYFIFFNILKTGRSKMGMTYQRVLCCQDHRKETVEGTFKELLQQTKLVSRPKSR